MSKLIHPSAVVEDGAVIGDECEIGPFCHIGPQVRLGAGARLKSHVVIAGDTAIGPGAKMYPFCSVGHQPQDLKFHGEPVTLTIGANVTIREGVTINPGTEGGGSKTVIGDNCSLLANVHIGHDCLVGNHVVLVNNVMLAGHVTVGDFAICAGGSAVIQFTRIGQHAFVGGLTGMENDLIPYGLATGNRAHLAGLNMVGLRRRNFSREAIHELRRAYRLLFAAEGTLKERVEDVAAEFHAHPQVVEIIDFIRAGTDRAICQPRRETDA